MNLQEIEGLIKDLELLLENSFESSVKYNKMQATFALAQFNYSVLLKDTLNKDSKGQDSSMTTINFYKKPSGYTSIGDNFRVGLVFSLNFHNLLAKFFQIERFISSPLSLKDNIATVINDFNTYFFLESLNKRDTIESEMISIIRSRKCFLYIEMDRQEHIQLSIVIKENLYNAKKPAYDNDDLSFFNAMNKEKNKVREAIPESVFLRTNGGYDGNIFNLIPRLNDYHDLINDEQARCRYISLKEIENL